MGNRDRELRTECIEMRFAPVALILPQNALATWELDHSLDVEASCPLSNTVHQG